MKDLGEADVILNLKLLREGNGGVTLLLSHLVLKNKTRLAICVPRKSTHTTTEAIISETMLYSGNILIIDTYIRVSRNGN